MLRENFERLNFCTKKNQKQGYWGVVGVTQNKTSPPSSRVWTSAFARQSASFALATTHSQDVLFNASRPYRRSPSAYFEGTHGVRFAWGNTRCSHKKVSSPCYITRSRAKKIHTRPFTCTIRQARRSLPRRLAARVPSAKLHIPLISDIPLKKL